MNQTSDILKKVRKIEIKTRRLSNHIFSGEYHSHFKGRGMTFSEVRPYQFGDDVRNIDWNVTARYNEPFVKVFEEERELTLMLMVDISGSEFFGTQNQFKKDTSVEIAATLAFSAIQNNDKVGLILFTDEIELFIPPKKGRSHVLRIIRELIEFQPKNRKTNIKKAFEFLSSVMKKRAIVFMLSDFMDINYEKELQIASKKHDLAGVRIFDVRETEMPNIGLLPVYDNENNSTLWIDTTSSKVRDDYSKHYRQRAHYFKTQFSKSGSGIIELDTQEDYVRKLIGYFKKN